MGARIGVGSLRVAVPRPRRLPAVTASPRSTGGIPEAARWRRLLDALQELEDARSRFPSRFAKDQLELTCRSVLGVLLLARSSFKGENELILNGLCDAVGQWLRREIRPLRFARMQ